MLIGHYAPALVLHRTRPAIPLWVLFVAAQAVDVVWALFVLAGVEHLRMVPGFTESNPLDLYDMPYSHSVVAAVVWSVGLAIAWRAVRPSKQWRDEALVVGLVVASHFVLDLVVHAHDLPIAGSAGTKLGFGLWNYREVALCVEGGLFVTAALVWWQRRDNRQPRAAVVLVAMTAVLVASFYIPAPPTPVMMALTGLATDTGCALAAWWAMRRSLGQ